MTVPARLLALLALLAGSLATSPAAAGPADDDDLFPPRDQQRVLMEEYRAAAIEYERSQMLACYRDGEYRDEKWDEAAEEFLERYAVYVTDPYRSDRQWLIAEGRRLLDLGCGDPLVAGLWGALTQGRREFSTLGAKGVGLYLTTYGPDKKGPHLRRARVELTTYQAVDYWNSDEEGAAGWARAAAESLHAALMERDLTTLEQRWVANCAAEMCAEMPVEVAAEFVHSILGSGAWPWATHLIAGAHHERLGWDVRGRGFAHTVTEEGWKGFREQFGWAREHFEAAHKMAPDRPEAASRMIEIAMAAGSDGEDRQWFQRAVAAQFDWMKAYDHYRWSLRPRWGGSREEMLGFGLACARTERFDTIVPVTLYFAVMDIAAESDDFDTVWKDDEIYQLLRDTLHPMVADAPTEYDAELQRRRLLTVAWRAGDYEEAAKWLPHITSAPGKEAPRHARTEFDQIRSDVLMHTSGIREIQQALDAESRESWPEAARLLEDASQHVEPGSDLAWAVADRLAIARFQQVYARRTPVEVPLTETLAGWRVHSGRWRMEDGVLIGDQAGDDGCEIVFGPSLGEHWLAEARLEMVHDKDNHGFGVTMLLNWENESYSSPRYDSIRLSGTYDTVRVGYRTGTRSRFDREPADDHLIRVERNGDQLKVWFDEKLIHDGPTTTRNWPRSGRIGFALDRTTVPRGAIRIRDIAVKRIVRGGTDEIPF